MSLFSDPRLLLFLIIVFFGLVLYLINREAKPKKQWFFVVTNQNNGTTYDSRDFNRLYDSQYEAIVAAENYATSYQLHSYDIETFTTL